MDQDRFDELAMEAAEEGASRRSLLGGALGGGLAALLGLFGLEDAEAKKNRKRRKRRERRKRQQQRRRQRRRNRGGGNGGGGGGGNGGGGGGGGNLGVPIGVGTIVNGAICTADSECASGNCANLVLGVGTCAECAGVRLCGDLCCVAGAACLEGTCVIAQG